MGRQQAHMRRYGKRPRMKCRSCGKDVAKNVTAGHERGHTCPHGKPCPPLVTMTVTHCAECKKANQRSFFAPENLTVGPTITIPSRFPIRR